MTFKLELTPSQIEIIDKGLQALPLGHALETWLAIKNQVETQKQNTLEENKLGGG